MLALAPQAAWAQGPAPEAPAPPAPAPPAPAPKAAAPDAPAPPAPKAAAPGKPGKVDEEVAKIVADAQKLVKAAKW